jgi:undecaprenyl phosphate N,N'-diacetylbacillosamine 1-phosphate transferase
MYRRFFKRLLDFLFSFLLLILTSPINIIVIIILAFANDGKVFFVQLRPGKGEKIFSIIKYKTMNDKRDANGNLLPDNKRITFLGKIIRKSSLDELPQLINVLLGDLSIIGPRPLLVDYLPLYNEFQNRRHEVRPGITGWAQVNGRNTITWQKKFEYDVWYVDNLSFSLDLRILLLTIRSVIVADNVNFSAGETMERFRGNN